jgi:hypothetical protein
MTAKLTMCLTPGFSPRPCDWRAVMPVGARGSLSWSYVLSDGTRQEREIPRWRQGLTLEQLAVAREQLSMVPEGFGPTADDVPTLGIEIDEGGEQCVRIRHLLPGETDDHVQAFDRIWMLLVSRVHAALKEHGAPEDLILFSRT